MVAKRSVIRMLLYRHYLNTIVSISDDAGKNVFSKLVICAHLLGILRHTNVAFVDKKGISVRFEICFLENIRISRRPNLCRKNLCLFVLHHTCGIRRNAFAFSSFPIYMKFVKISVVDGFCREFNFPVSIVTYTRKFIF